eukprot:jgi/Hompol1/1855/HPOL_005750-RA
MNLGLIGLFSNNIDGLLGGYFSSITHGFISSALFLLVGIIYDRTHTRIIKYYRGLILFMPLFIIFFFLFILSNMGFPGFSGYIGEMLIYFSLLNINPIIVLLSTLVAILLPIYTLWFFQRMAYGQLSVAILILYQDLTIKEFHLILPLFFFNLILGIFPDILTNVIQFNLLSIISHTIAPSLINPTTNS